MCDNVCLSVSLFSVFGPKAKICLSGVLFTAEFGSSLWVCFINKFYHTFVFPARYAVNMIYEFISCVKGFAILITGMFCFLSMHLSHITLQARIVCCFKLAEAKFFSISERSFGQFYDFLYMHFQFFLFISYIITLFSELCNS